MPTHFSVRPPKRNVPPWMNLASFYVLISRCKTTDSLRLYQYDREGLNDLYRLKHDEYLAFPVCVRVVRIVRIVRVGCHTLPRSLSA